MLNREVEFGLGMLVRDAREQHQEFLSVEHLLMMLTDMSGPAKILRAIGADLDVLRDRLQKHIDEHTPRFADTDPRDPQPTLGFQRVLQRAIFQAQSAGRSEVEPDNLLVATFSEQESHAVFFLAEQNISRLDVVSFIAHGEEELRAEVEANEERFRPMENAYQRPQMEMPAPGVQAASGGDDFWSTFSAMSDRNPAAAWQLLSQATPEALRSKVLVSEA